MKKTGWTRGLALVLALVLLVTAVGALNYDWNSDGKTNVWDLQLGINDNKTIIANKPAKICFVIFFIIKILSKKISPTALKGSRA